MFRFRWTSMYPVSRRTGASAGGCAFCPHPPSSLYFCPMSLRLISLIAVLILAPTLLAAQPTKPIEPKHYAYLPILHEHQSPNLCLPTCVAMLLTYYGDQKTQWTIKRLSNERKDIFSATSF